MLIFKKIFFFFLWFLVFLVFFFFFFPFCSVFVFVFSCLTWQVHGSNRKFDVKQPKIII